MGGKKKEKNVFDKLILEIRKRDSQSTEALRQFIDRIVYDDLSEGDKKEISLEFVYEAYEWDDKMGKLLIDAAIELDPTNVDAYNYMAELEKDLEKAKKIYEVAIEIAKKNIGEEEFESNRGEFWGLRSTRPYMRAMAGLADCLYENDEMDKSIEIYKEMLELNPRDNQGVRFVLSTFLLGKEDLSEFESFMDGRDVEDNIYWIYNTALYYFKKYGRTEKADKYLMKAYKINKFVIDYLLRIKKLPYELPFYTIPGSEDEAIIYVYYAWKVWKNAKGVVRWLKNFRK